MSLYDPQLLKEMWRPKWWTYILCISRLVLLGYKKSLEDGDLWAPNPRDMTCNTYPVFDQEWKKELAQTEVYVINFKHNN